MRIWVEVGDSVAGTPLGTTLISKVVWTATGGYSWGYGVPLPIPQPIAVKCGEDRRPPILSVPLGGRACGIDWIAFSDSFVEPLLHFPQQPHHSTLAEPDPFGEPPCLLETCNMLRRVRNAADRSELLFRYDLLRKHRTLPWKGASTLRLRRTGGGPTISYARNRCGDRGELTGPPAPSVSSGKISDRSSQDSCEGAIYRMGREMRWSGCGL